MFDFIGKFQRILFDLIDKSQFARLFSSSTPVGVTAKTPRES